MLAFTNACKGTYLELFGQLRKLCENVSGPIDWSKRLFLADFEIGAINALKQTFPGAAVKGCNFHFRQSLYQNLDSGLKATFNTGKWEVSKNVFVDMPEVQNWIKLIMAMCLLPVGEISRVWSFLKHPPETSHQKLAASLSSFVSYFKPTYIERPTRRPGVMRAPQYPPTLWSHWDNDGAQTTNMAEGWHNALDVALTRLYRPPICVVLPWLRIRWTDNQIRITQLLAHGKPKPKEAKYAAIDTRIQKAKNSLSASFSCFSTFTIGYYHAIFKFLDKCAGYIGASKIDKK